jgi:hypothetical protein
MVSICIVIQDAEAGHFAKAPGVLEYWCVGGTKIPNHKSQQLSFQCSVADFSFYISFP